MPLAPPALAVSVWVLWPFLLPIRGDSPLSQADPSSLNRNRGATLTMVVFNPDVRQSHLERAVPVPRASASRTERRSVNAEAQGSAGG